MKSSESKRKSLKLGLKFEPLLKKEAAKLGMNVNALINHILELYFRNFIKKEEKNNEKF